MPTYNHDRFIGEAIGSVLSQSFTNLELIIVDNHSQDRTCQVVASFSDQRVRYVKFANNGVIAASRNHGISLAQGEYLAFLDSDDIWLPGKLEEQAEILRAPGSPVMTYSRYRTIAGAAVSDKVYPSLRRCVSGDVFNALYLRHFIACSGVMAKKKYIVEAGGFDESPELLAVEDMDLWLKLSLLGDIQCASREPLFHYRVHPDNLSRGYFKKYKRALTLLSRFSGKAGFLAFSGAVALFSLSVLKQKLAAICADTIRAREGDSSHR